MLVSIKIKKSIENEVKSQKNLLKALENQETNYKVNLTKQKEDINKSIEYYTQILEEVA